MTRGRLETFISPWREPTEHEAEILAACDAQERPIPAPKITMGGITVFEGAALIRHWQRQHGKPGEAEPANDAQPAPAADPEPEPKPEPEPVPKAAGGWLASIREALAGAPEPVEAPRAAPVPPVPEDEEPWPVDRGEAPERQDDPKRGEFLTLDGIAGMLGVSRSLVKRWRAEGSLPAATFAMGKVKRWDPAAIRRWAAGRGEARKRPPKPVSSGARTLSENGRQP